MGSAKQVSIAARVHAMLWGVFGIGGFVAALLLPVIIYLNNIAYPLGLWPMAGKDPTSLLVGHRLSSLFILVTIAGSLYHGIFRFQTTLAELGLGRYKEKLAALGYAVIGPAIVLLLIYLLALNPGLLRLP